MKKLFNELKYVVLAIIMGCVWEYATATELPETATEETTEMVTEVESNSSQPQTVYVTDQEMEEYLNNSTEIVDENGNVDWSIFEDESMDMEEFYTEEGTLAFSAYVEPSVMTQCNGVTVTFTDAAGNKSEVFLSYINSYTSSLLMDPSTYTLQNVVVNGYENPDNLIISYSPKSLELVSLTNQMFSISIKEKAPVIVEEPEVIEEVHKNPVTILFKVLIAVGVIALVLGVILFILFKRNNQLK